VGLGFINEPALLYPNPMVQEEGIAAHSGLPRWAPGPGNSNGLTALSEARRLNSPHIFRQHPSLLSSDKYSAGGSMSDARVTVPTEASLLSRPSPQPDPSIPGTVERRAA
jgi:hypothetical protein